MFTFLMLDCYVIGSKNTGMWVWLVQLIQRLNIVGAWWWGDVLRAFQKIKTVR